MSRVYLTIPSARPPAEAEKVLSKWKQRGYGIALMVDSRADIDAKQGMADIVMAHADGYQGYAKSVNFLIGKVLLDHPECEWCVAAGDDIEPDMAHTADEIADQCNDHFHYLGCEPCQAASGPEWKTTFGVMQPTGDRWGEVPNAPPGALQGSYSDRVAGSAWIGREFARRVNRGNGPLWPDYVHMFVDQEIQEVAMKYGVFWQRRDLIQLHNHWARKRGQVTDMPEFLREANSQEHWNKYKAIFESRKAAGFPGSELL